MVYVLFNIVFHIRFPCSTLLISVGKYWMFNVNCVACCQLKASTLYLVEWEENTNTTKLSLKKLQKETYGGVIHKHIN
jgi:hypothetical protein